jgi:hypothetical protein
MRNRLAGRKLVSDSDAGATTRFYRKNPAARRKKMAYMKKYNNRPERVAYRMEHNKKANEMGVNGKRASRKKDLVRGKDGRLRLGSMVANRKAANRKR